jgi:hypothetical protein
MKKYLLLLPVLFFSVSATALADDDRTAGVRVQAQKSQSVPARPGEKIDGWGKLTFGMTAEEAVAASPEIEWPENTCLKTGTSCKMKPASDYVAVIGGIGFIPELEFDRFGRLVKIALNHEARNLSDMDCWGRLNTTMAGLEKRFGKFGAPMTEGLKLEKRRTPGGSHYAVEWLNMDGLLFLMFKTASDVAAFDMSERNELAGTSLRASRPFISIVGMTMEDSRRTCTYGVYYNAADMEAPKGEPSSDNSGF